jgi:peptidoglycan/xylan/chitin deacetylase (PgdA/CDA1 family)
MTAPRLSINRRLFAVVLLVSVAPFLDPCLLSAAQQVTVIAEQATPSVGPTTDSHQPTLTEKRRAKVPILVYHHVSQSAPEGSPGRRRLTVTAEIFAEQMQYLQDNGYHVITFSDLADYFEQGRELPTLPVIISFDDGWETPFEYALPSLEKYHYPATFFVVTDYIGRPGFFSWPQLQTLLTDGMTIGSHSRSHPRLNKIIDSAELWDQIYNSKIILETQLETPVQEFAYPYGSYNAKAVEVVKSAGYRAGRGCCSGIAHTSVDVFKLKAVMVPNDMENFVKYIGGR